MEKRTLIRLVAAWTIVVVAVAIVANAPAMTPATPRFYEGQLVSPVLNDRRGQIIDTTCRSGKDAICWYTVRFDVPGGAAVQVHNVREYELKAIYP